MIDQAKSKQEMAAQPDRQSARMLYGRLLRDYVSRYKFKVIAAIFFMILGAATTAATAFLMKPIVDRVFLEKDENTVLYTTLSIVAVFAARGFAAFWQTVLMNWVGSKVVADIQSDLFSKVVNADLAWFHANPTGQLISRFVFDTTLLRTGTTQTLIVLTKDSLTAIFLVGSLFYYDWKMAFFIVVVLPPSALAIKQLGRRSRKAIKNNLEQTGHFSSFLEEVFQGIRVVKAYSQEAQTQKHGDEVIERRFKYDLKAMQVQATANPIVESVSGGIIAAVIYYGASSVTAGETTPGTFFAFITAVMLAYQPIKSVAKITPQMQNGVAAAERVFHMMDVVHEVTEKEDAKPLVLEKGEVQFDHVTFSYGGEEAILRDLSLTLEAGKRIALVGPSGGGKSTIMNLIPRFYDVAEGRILIDGQDTRDVTFRSLRDKIALVSQDIFLFDDTVRANIAYGGVDASEEDIVAAAKDAAAHDFIMALPEGYDTKVGADGVRLSGGQKQRIAIARAMLKDAPILLLDEATSALDTESERKIQSALTRLMEGRTSLVIAHRLSTILDADRIYVIVEGRVAESGTHAELLEISGVYADLYNKQFESDSSIASVS
ncbi:ABC transporter ATP-binding protein [Sneathiella aquimaris]|uniref:ABC transporter ATP-binding protein n=1 Tax=Sneathiella aquimaris TaxID=2599305 RepID=UPI001C67156B|nr:ABC transporter ATP-binding protein [Sneathiella aquimaris]